MEFPDLGQNCAKEDCNQLDFLPANCVHCSQVFCSEHLSPFVHECPQFKEKTISDAELEAREKQKWQIKCSLASCKAKDLLPMKCVRCGLHFCLAHRHFDQHQCSVVLREDKAKEEQARKAAATAASGKEMQMRIKQDITTRLEEASKAGGAKGVMATKLALMKLKGRAKGDAAVQTTDRIFFSVECCNKEQNPKPLDVWMSTKWTLGKAIDFMARQARMKNRNNVKDAPKLHLFKNELCLSKPSDKTIDEIVTQGLIVDGDALQFKLVEEENS